MDDWLQEDGLQPGWDVKNLQESKIDPEQLHMEAGYPGIPQGKETAQLCWHPVAEWDSAPTLCLGGLSFRTRGVDGRPPCTQAPRAAEI